MFDKRLADLTRDDIQGLIDRKVAEGQDVEFKSQVSGWQIGGQIPDKSRNSLLKEIVAFANASGGTLVIGIRESSDNPKHADSIAPLERCAEHLLT